MRRITKRSKPDFWTFWVSPESLWQGAGTLAYAFHFQPSEIDGSELEDFFAWVVQATRDDLP